MQGSPAAIEGDGIFVAHFLQIVGDEGGAEAASTVEYEGRIFVGIFCFHVALDGAFAHVDRALDMARTEFVILADVDEHGFFAICEHGFVARDIGFANTRFRVIDKLQKALIVCHTITLPE